MAWKPLKIKAFSLIRPTSQDGDLARIILSPPFAEGSFFVFQTDRIRYHLLWQKWAQLISVTTGVPPLTARATYTPIRFHISCYHTQLIVSTPIFRQEVSMIKLC